MDRRRRYADQLARQAEKHGATHSTTKSGAIRVRTETGKVIVLHLTPGDNRHWKNLRAKWERHGLTWPWKTDVPG